MRTTTSLCLVIAAMLAAGCSRAPASTGATSPTNTGGEATPTEAPATAKIVCNLACSGKEAKGYGATEEEARADARRHVAETCNRDDGQHFIFCEPLE